MLVNSVFLCFLLLILLCCPYYFVDDSAKTANLQGILATLCPADKKIIHGMKDAALLPCFVQPESELNG